MKLNANGSSRYLALVVLAALASACSQEHREKDLSTLELSERDDALFVATTTLWSTNSVSVCWVNRDSRTEVHQWVQDAINRTWEFASNVDFVGWGDCGVGGADIEISVGDSLGPAVWGGLGTGITSMTLNFDPNSSYCGFGHPDETYRTCMDFIAIHEFGHALGFAHEQNRDDRPLACTEPDQGSDGDETFGDFDWDSVMNYCNPAYAAHPRLSATDFRGSQHYYGMSGRYIAAVVAAL